MGTLNWPTTSSSASSECCVINIDPSAFSPLRARSPSHCIALMPCFWIFEYTNRFVRLRFRSFSFALICYAFSLQTNFVTFFLPIAVYCDPASCFSSAPLGRMIAFRSPALFPGPTVVRPSRRVFVWGGCREIAFCFHLETKTQAPLPRKKEKILFSRSALCAFRAA